MKIGNRMNEQNAMARTGQSQNAEGKTKGNSAVSVTENLPEKKQDSLELSKTAQAQLQAEEKAVESKTSTNTGAVASNFATTEEYHAYLKDTYPSINNSNIEISETVLKQAMSDPAKEKVLTDFLTGLDGAKDYRADQIAGMSDDTYTYELKSFGIKLDSIADDNSGINGEEFGEIIVARNDGQRMSDEEFAGVKSNVLEQLKEMTDEQNERFKRIFEVLLKNKDDHRIEKPREEEVETERLEDIVNEQIEEKRKEMREEMRREMQEKMLEDMRQTTHGQNYSTKI